MVDEFGGYAIPYIDCSHRGKMEIKGFEHRSVGWANNLLIKFKNEVYYITTMLDASVYHYTVGAQSISAKTLVGCKNWFLGWIS